MINRSLNPRPALPRRTGPLARVALVALAIGGCGLQTRGYDAGKATSGGGAGSGEGGGGSGAGGAPTVCSPGETMVCYSGLDGTEGVGPCKAGTQTCAEDGSGFGPCEGEVQPAVEDCTTIDIDENCNGMTVVDPEGECVCAPGTSTDCTTALLGVCADGTALCDPSGKALGACEAKAKPSFDDCETLPDEDCDGQAQACTGGALWAKAFGTAAADEAVLDVAADAAGNSYLGGIFSSQVWFAKLDPMGMTLWEKKVLPSGAGGNAAVNGIAVDPNGNVIVCGGLYGSMSLGGATFAATTSVDMFVAKFSPTGDHLWSKAFGDGAGPDYQNCFAIATSQSGDIFLTGRVSGTASFDGQMAAGSAEDLFVAKLSSAGAVTWVKRAGDAVKQEGWGIAADPAGDVFVAGVNAGAMNFGGGQSIATGPAEDGFVAKLAGADGSGLWARSLGDAAGQGTFSQSAFAVAADTNGDAVVLGRFAKSVSLEGTAFLNVDTTGASSDIILAKYSAAGALVWGKSFGAPSSQRGLNLALDEAGHILITGTFRGDFNLGGATLPAANKDASGDIFLAKLTAAGDHLWSARFGDTGDDIPGGVATDGKGNVFLAGQFTLTLTPGGGVAPITSLGLYDGFVMKLSP